jgi:phage shock protein C
MEKKLRRSRSNQMIAGVCAGLAEYLNIDVTIVRVAYVLLSVFSAGFPGLIVYIILMLVMPLD